MFAGLDGARFDDFCLESEASDYAYLNGGFTPKKLRESGAKPRLVELPENASVTFQLLTQSMEDAGFDTEELDMVLTILAIILHIGNIDFKELQDLDKHYFELEVEVNSFPPLYNRLSRTQGPLHEASSLLGCQFADLKNALSTSIMMTRGETIVLRNTEDSARDARDAMSKVQSNR